MVVFTWSRNGSSNTTVLPLSRGEGRVCNRLHIHQTVKAKPGWKVMIKFSAINSIFFALILANNLNFDFFHTIPTNYLTEIA